MRSRAVPVLIPCANADQAAVSHVDRDKQLFSLLGRYGALPKNHGVRINVVVDGGENIHCRKAHALQDDVCHGFPIEYRKLLRQLHIVDVVVEQLALHISEVFGNIQLMLLLQEEAELDEIVKLVGMDALSAPDRLKLEAARSIREDYLHQNAFNDTDTYTSLDKQHMMMQLILEFYHVAGDALSKGAKVNDLVNIPVREAIGRFKYVEESKTAEEYKNIVEELKKECDEALSRKEDF